MAFNRKAALAGSKPMAKRLSLMDATDAMLPTQTGATPTATPSAVVVRDDNTIVAGPFTLTRTGLQVTGEINEELWEVAGRYIGQTGTAWQFWIGDWMNAAPGEWGSMYERAAEITGFKTETLKNLASVSRKVQLSLRNDNLTYNHHVAVAKLPEDQQLRWLSIAIEKRYSVPELRSAIKAQITSSNPDRTNEIKAFIAEADEQLREITRGVKKRKVSLSRIQALRAWLERLEEAIKEGSIEEA
jgi:hypothetical protein